MSVLISSVWAGLVAASLAGAPPSPPAPPGAPSEREEAKTTADTLLGQAQSVGEAALAWLERRGADAEDRFNAALSDALERAKAGRTFGVRLLGAGKDPATDAPSWNDLPDRAPARLVLLVHGMDEPGGIWDDLAPALAKAGHAVARFDYPNDQPLASSADELAGALRDLRRCGTVRVDIVAHSAGGLIARDVLTRGKGTDGEDEKPADAGGLPAVGRLILIGTPNRGAALARFRGISELREQFIRWIESDGRDPAALLGFMHDGGGEVAADLRPGSAYLEDLNARPLPVGVKITAVVGTVAERPAAELKGMLRWPFVRRLLSPEEVREAEAAINELSQVMGDGVVPVQSQVLEGVEDVVRLEANHRSMLRHMGLPVIGGVRGTTDAGPPPPAVDVVLERLAE